MINEQVKEVTEKLKALDNYAKSITSIQDKEIRKQIKNYIEPIKKKVQDQADFNKELEELYNHLEAMQMYTDETVAKLNKILS